MMTHDLSQPSLSPITHRGFADSAPGDKGEATDRRRFLRLNVDKQYDQRVLPAPPSLTNARNIV